MKDTQSSRKLAARRPTSEDVARLAGVSRATVSFVMNDVQSASISKETQARVWEAIAQLDYHPHEAARNLRSQSSRILAAAIPDASNPHYLQLFSGVEAYAKEKGYSVFLSTTNFKAEEEKRCFDWLKQKRSDALIMISEMERTLLEELRTIHQHKYIVTSVGSAIVNKLDLDIDSIITTPRLGEQLMLEHLASLGHRRIGYIYGVANMNTLGDRLTTCLEIQQAMGIPVVEKWIRACDPSQAGAYQATQLLLDTFSPAELPTALIVVNDLLATAVLAALAAAHVAVPAQISVIGFDNIAPAAYTVPALTTIDNDGFHLGWEAARITIERLNMPDRPSVRQELSSKLVVRQSTGPARELDIKL